MRSPALIRGIAGFSAREVFRQRLIAAGVEAYNGAATYMKTAPPQFEAAAWEQNPRCRSLILPGLHVVTAFRRQRLPAPPRLVAAPTHRGALC